MSYLPSETSLIDATALGKTDTEFCLRSIETLLLERKKNHPSYLPAEIEQISGFSFSLFPPGYKLTLEEDKLIRAMVRSYRLSIKPPYAITSHRKIIGPAIVAAKKVIWRVLDYFLRGSFEQLEDFHRYSIRCHAQHLINLRKD